MFTAADVTLYVPCYQAKNTIGACIEGIQQQSVTPKRVLLVDDGSQPPLQLDPIEVIRHTENSGLATARNTALNACTTPLIASLDSDVVPADTWLEQLLSAMNETGAAGVGGRMTEHHQDCLGDCWRAIHMAQHWGDELQRNPRFLFGANTLFRAELVKEAGGYDTRLRTNNEDRTLCEALHGAGHDLVYTPEATCRHLRRDSYRTILRSYWQWHHAKGLVAGDFDSSEGIIQRIEKVNFGIFDYRYKMDLENDRPIFAALDACIPWVFSAIDLQLYARRNDQPVPDLLGASELPGSAASFVRRLLPTARAEEAAWHGAYMAEFLRCLKEYKWTATAPRIAELAGRVDPLTDSIPIS